MNAIYDVLAIVEQGGWVTLPLLLVSGLLCYTVCFRWLSLQRGYRGSLRLLVRGPHDNDGHQAEGLLPHAARKLQAATQGDKSLTRMDEVIMELNQELHRYQHVVRTLVMIAPLLGLLGTVIGMIETFESLGDMSLFSQSGGIAGGISQALITTQMGLIIAIPGMFFDRFLARREAKLRDEILQIREIISQQS
jgi:biopolymer transport protein ExbB